MKQRTRSIVMVSASVAVLALLSGILVYWAGEGPQGVGEPADLFTSTDFTGSEFSLSDNAGKVTIIHFTQLENPLCIECEDAMRSQIEELEALVSSDDPRIEVITVNIRKNPYSDDGWWMAQEWYGANISWHWIEEFEPYPVSGGYIQFWQLDGAFSNPSIVLIDQDLTVVGVHHVYCIGRGEIDGVQDAASLAADADSILSGTWEIDDDTDAAWKGASVGGMFLLGVVTSFSPCSIAFLMAVVSFVGAASTREAATGTKEPLLGIGLRLATVRHLPVHGSPVHRSVLVCARVRPGVHGGGIQRGGIRKPRVVLVVVIPTGPSPAGGNDHRAHRKPQNARQLEKPREFFYVGHLVRLLTSSLNRRPHPAGRCGWKRPYRTASGRPDDCTS